MDQDTFQEAPLSWKWLWVPALGGVVAVAAVLAIGAVAQRGRGQDVSNAWARYSRCLIGDTPLAPGETLGARLKRIGQTIDDDSKASDWPSRCDSFGEDFTKAAQALADKDPRYKTLAYYGEQSFPLSSEKTGILADLFDKIGAARLPAPVAGPIANDVLPPKPQQTLSLDGMAVVAYGDPYLAKSEATPGAPVRLLWDTWPRRYCRVDAPFDVARCRDLSPSITGQAELAPTEDAAFEPLVDVDGENRVVVHGFSGALASSRADVKGTTIGDQLWSYDEVGGQTSIELRPASNPNAKPTKLATHAKADANFTFRGCRMPDASFAVVALTNESAEIFFQTGTTWSPVAPAPWTSIRSQRVTCRAGEVTLTGIVGRIVSQLRCTMAGCTRTDSQPLQSDVYSDNQDITGSAAIDLDGKVLLVGAIKHHSKLGELDGLQFRLAAISDLTSARDVLLLGADDSHDGIWWNHVQLYVRGPHALLVLRGADNRFYLARIDSSGAFDHVLLERE